MALTLSELKTVAKNVGQSIVNPTMKFSYNDGGNKYEACGSQIEELFVSEMRNLCGYDKYTQHLNIHEYERNQIDIYELMEVAIDEALPIKVMEQYNQFAEFLSLKEEQRPVFYKRITEASKRRAKTFVTKAADAGIYEVFRLDGRKYEAQLFNVAGACEISIEDFITGRFTMADVMQVMLEAMNDIILKEIECALKSGVVSLQTANKRVCNGFSATDFNELLNISDAYGEGSANIFCTQDFAYKMVPDVNWASDSMKEKIWTDGYFTTYKKHSVFILKQSFEDETNTKKIIDPGYVWILPNGAGNRGKMVKIATVGKTRSRSNNVQSDWSMKFEMFKKMAICVMFDNDICVYIDTSLTFADGDTAADYGIN